MLLEDYETKLSMSLARGQAYRQELEESEAELVATMGLDGTNKEEVQDGKGATKSIAGNKFEEDDTSAKVEDIL